ncbi:DUF4168 domain-containing protein [Halopseudomonas aestusnigri]|uniref:DUF4168 domain-containing protein n=1 Tax=Halopseudomonas aestusnigri TaxID=857252 RepID=A0AAQ1G534_9GAMM|nr:DUF4168 domain-containing protein [Halopseudomonas aestusnigri]SEF61467.1 protein of unknown function [Halopseudomonas aestusnigri]
MMNLKKLTAALCVVTLSAGAPFAIAQTAGGAAGQQYGEPSAAAAAAPVSESDLEKFVSAEEKVNEIRQELTDELRAASDQEQAQQLQFDAQQEMVEAVESSGIEVARYNEIASRMQTDTELRERAQQLN